MHILMMVVGGFVALVVFILAAVLLGRTVADGARVFIWPWLAVALINMFVGVYWANIPYSAEIPVLVVVFGGLTFLLDDPRFIMVKPTIINLGFAGILFGGLILRRTLLKMLFGEAFNLTEEGWRKLSLRWALFFLTLAGLNEVVWRNFSEATWVNFKVFGILPLTLVFAMAQIGLIKRHEAKTGA